MTNGFTPGGYAFTAQYDAENRLTNISYTDNNNVTHTASFIYDANGFIAKQVVDGVETRFVRDTNFNVLQERDSTNAVTRSYVWDEVSPGGIGGLLELTQVGQQYDYLYDGKGNVSAVIDTNQNIVASYAYNPFGKLLAKSGTLDQPYMFSTKPDYQVYGKIYFGYRWYDLSCMKWMTRDPSGEEGGLNLYGFASNSPINDIDDLGLWVTVILYAGEGLNKWDHVGIGINTYDTVGFYAKNWNILDGPGIWEEDNRPAIMPPVTIDTDSCGNQDGRMLADLVYDIENPGDYHLFSRNCATQIENILADGGIYVNYTIKPDQLYDELINYHY